MGHPVAMCDSPSAAVRSRCSEPPVPAGAPAQDGVPLVVLGAPLAEDGEAAVVHEDVLVRVLVLPHLLRRNAVIGGNHLKCISSIEVN